MEELYPYYERELEFIRQMGGEFAARYPKVAGRLQLDKDRPADPHVERLIEAFALLAGRVQHKLDDEFPEVTESLLDLLYPHYLRPVPSLAVVQFEPDVDQSKPEAARVPAGVLLHSRPAGGTVCTFRTCYPVELWPLHVRKASLETPASAGAPVPTGVAHVIRLEMEASPGLTFGKLPLSNLRFYLSGPPRVTHALYESLVLDLAQVIVRDKRSDGPAFTLDPAQLRPAGLSAAEGLLPYSDCSFLGYRLLQEYFHFPEKFLFIDLHGLNAAARSAMGSRFEILFCLRPGGRPEFVTRLEQGISANTFQLGCTPIVNLFERTAETIRLAQTRYEYQVVPDQHRLMSTEVYSIDEVTSTAKYLEEAKVYQPFYSFRHGHNESASGQFWFARRKPSLRPKDAGTEVYLSLVDLAFQPSLPPVEMLTVGVTCTNRDLPGSLDWSGDWGELSAEGQTLVRIRLLRKPTPTLRPPLRRGLQWRLISHLSLNHLSIVEEGLDALQEILGLYNFAAGDDAFAIRKQILGITSLTSRPVMSRVISDAGVTFCRGIEVGLEFDEEQYAGAGVFLFASVLERFFGLYAAVNSFSRLTVKTKQRKGVLKQWPPLAGEQRIQ